MVEFVVEGQDSGHIGGSDGRKKKEVVCAVKLTETGKVKWFYVLPIKYISAKSLLLIFESHIAKDAQVQKDKRKGDCLFKKSLPSNQIPNELGLSLNAIHTMYIR